MTSDLTPVEQQGVAVQCEHIERDAGREFLRMQAPDHRRLGGHGPLILKARGPMQQAEAVSVVAVPEGLLNHP